MSSGRKRRRQRARRRCKKERLQSADLFVAWTVQVSAFSLTLSFIEPIIYHASLSFLV
jgi:hypothetical protein